MTSILCAKPANMLYMNCLEYYRKQKKCKALHYTLHFLYKGDSYQRCHSAFCQRKSPFEKGWHFGWGLRLINRNDCRQGRTDDGDWKHPSLPKYRRYQTWELSGAVIPRHFLFHQKQQAISGFLCLSPARKIAFYAFLRHYANSFSDLVLRFIHSGTPRVCASA